MSVSKVDLVLRQLDVIKSACDQAVSDLGVSPQPILQFFGPPIPPALMLFRAAYDRSLLQRVLDVVPEPPDSTREVFHRAPPEARQKGAKQGKKVA